jgi:hypothetical protein
VFSVWLDPVTCILLHQLALLLPLPILVRPFLATCMPRDHCDVLRLPAFGFPLLVLLIWLVALCNTSLPSVVFDPGHLILLWALSRWLVLTLLLSLPLAPLDLRPEITSLPLFLPALSTFDALVLSWLGLRCLVPVVSIGLRLLAVRRVLCWTIGFPHRTAPLL